MFQKVKHGYPKSKYRPITITISPFSYSISVIVSQYHRAGFSVETWPAIHSHNRHEINAGMMVTDRGQGEFEFLPVCHTRRNRLLSQVVLHWVTCQWLAAYRGIFWLTTYLRWGLLVYVGEEILVHFIYLINLHINYYFYSSLTDINYHCSALYIVVSWNNIMQNRWIVWKV